MPIELEIVGNGGPDEGSTNAQVAQMLSWWANNIPLNPSNYVNGSAAASEVNTYLPIQEVNPALMRGVLSTLIIQASAAIPSYQGLLNNIFEQLDCICQAIQNLNVARLQVVSTVTVRPVNIGLSVGAPGPDIFAGGWVLFHDAAGNVGERSFIFADNQRHVSDIPNATGFTYHLLPGFTVIFS